MCVFFFVWDGSREGGTKLIYKFTLAINDVQQREEKWKFYRKKKDDAGRGRRKFKINDKYEELIKMEEKFLLSLKTRQNFKLVDIIDGEIKFRWKRKETKSSWQKKLLFFLLCSFEIMMRFVVLRVVLKKLEKHKSFICN